jgi:hypothetical protein
MGKALKQKPSAAYPTWTDLLRNFLKDCDCERGIDALKEIRQVLDQIAEVENLKGNERLSSMAIIIRQILSEIPMWDEHRCNDRQIESHKMQAEMGQLSLALYDYSESLDLIFRQDQTQALQGALLLDVLHQCLVPSDLNSIEPIAAHFSFQRSLALVLLVFKFFPPDHEMIDTVFFQKILGLMPSECAPINYGRVSFSFIRHLHKGKKSRPGLLFASSWSSGIEEVIQSIPSFHSPQVRASKMRTLWYLLNALLCDVPTKYVFVLFAKSRNIKNTETAVFINEKMHQTHGITDFFTESQLSDLMSKSIRSNMEKAYARTFGEEPIKMPSQDFATILHTYQLGLLPLPEVLQHDLIREIIIE